MRYLIRLDDACPTMDKTKWKKIISILELYRIRPLIGVIPNCKDPNMNYTENETEGSFWRQVREWQDKNFTIALHGYDHCYISQSGGINPINSKSEFAGVPIEIQKNKLKMGYDIMKGHGIIPEWFFAPSHTYDKNTLIALQETTDIRNISDTIALKPYKRDGFTYYPVQSGHFFTPWLNGIWTFCFHPSMMSEKHILEMELFIEKNQKKFCSFDSPDIHVQKKKSGVDTLLSYAYFSFRKIKKIKKTIIGDLLS